MKTVSNIINKIALIPVTAKELERVQNEIPFTILHLVDTGCGRSFTTADVPCGPLLKVYEIQKIIFRELLKLLNYLNDWYCFLVQFN